MTAARSHPSELVLDAIAAGDRASAEAETHLAQCARCQQAVAATRAAHDLFSRQVLARTLPEVTARALGGGSRSWLAPLVLVPVLAVAVVVWLPRRPAPRAELGIKGAPTLRVYVRRGAQVSPVSAGDHLSAGDQLRFQIEPGGFPFVVVVSIDAADHASIYLPFEGTESAAVDGQRTFTSPDSVILDAAPGPERVFALFSRKPLPVDRATSALKTIGRGGAAAVREARVLPLDVDAQVSLLWEQDRP